MPGCSERGRGEIGVETAEDFEEVAGTEGKADAGDFFADNFGGVETDDFATGVEERTAGIARIDLGIGLNPGARASVGKVPDGTDDALGDAEKHAIAGIADRENGFTLANE